MEKVFLFVTGSALLGLIVLNPTLVAGLLQTVRDTITSGFAVARK